VTVAELIVELSKIPYADHCPVVIHEVTQDRERYANSLKVYSFDWTNGDRHGTTVVIEGRSS